MYVTISLKGILIWEEHGSREEFSQIITAMLRY